LDGEALHRRDGPEGRLRLRAASRRLRLHARVPHRALLPGHPPHDHRRWDLRDHEGDHRQADGDMTPVDFVAIGHVTLDQTPRGTRPGGAAYYTAMTAHRLGLRVGLLTSFGPDFPRDAIPAGIDVVTVPSERTTTFRISSGGPGRAARARPLAVLARSADLEADALPEAWRDATLGALAPVTGEVDPAFAAAFPET